jgi:hypothetical protein
MANWYEPTTGQLADYEAWKNDRPPHVRVLAERLLPWKLYRLASSGHRVVVRGFDDSGADGDFPPVALVRIAVLGRFNLVEFERQVFGIQPDDLVECELPLPGEPVGSRLTQEEAKDSLDVLRVRVRPDLWRMGPDDKAVWIGPAHDDPDEGCGCGKPH